MLTGHYYRFPNSKAFFKKERKRKIEFFLKNKHTFVTTTEFSETMFFKKL